MRGWGNIPALSLLKFRVSGHCRTAPGRQTPDTCLGPHTAALTGLRNALPPLAV